MPAAASQSGCARGGSVVLRAWSESTGRKLQYVTGNGIGTPDVRPVEENRLMVIHGNKCKPGLEPALPHRRRMDQRTRSVFEFGIEIERQHDGKIPGEYRSRDNAGSCENVPLITVQVRHAKSLLIV